MDQYKVNIHGASPIHGDDDPPVGAITIFEPIPESNTRTEDELRDIYAYDAEQLLSVLTNCLPQGTLDHLLIRLLTDKASLLRVRAPQRRWTAEPTT
jgi:hypothetical protein